MYIARLTPESALRDLDNTFLNVRRESLILHDASLAGNISAEQIDRIIAFFSNVKTLAAQYIITPGLQAFAAAQRADVPGYDIILEHNTVIAAIDAVVNWMSVNFPKDGNGYELAYTRDVNGNKTYRTFSTASASSLRTLLQSIINAIEA